jgi:subtilisin family serine protease
VHSADLYNASKGKSSLENPSQWIVRLNGDAVANWASPAASQAAFAEWPIPFRVTRGLGLPGQLLVEAASTDDRAIRDALAANPHIASFEPNLTIRGQQTPNDLNYGFLTGLNNTGPLQSPGLLDADIDAPEAWDITTGSSGIVVAVIDSGVDYTHPDLYLNIWINQGEIPAEKAEVLVHTDADELITFRDLNHADNADFVTDLNGNSYIDAGDLLADPTWKNVLDEDDNKRFDDLVGYDFQDGDGDPRDEHRHGTHVAGILGAKGNNGVGVTGVNWDTSIMPLRFLDENNEGATADAIQAINYAKMMRTRPTNPVNVRVMNNSWGQQVGFSQNMFDAVKASAEADILFVAAAGNGDALGRGIDLDTDLPFYPASFDLPNIVSVAAVDSYDALARFSNFGPRSVDIAAPGMGVLSTEPGGTYGSRNGTSMATPYVSGVAALAFARHHRRLRWKFVTRFWPGQTLLTRLSGYNHCRAR